MHPYRGITSERTSTRFDRRRIVFAFVIACCGVRGFADDRPGPVPRSIEPDAATGSSAAVVVGDWPLVHTGQLLPLDGQGGVVAGGAAAQVPALFDRLALVLGDARSGLDRVVKLNVYVAREQVVGDVQRAMAARFRGPNKPAVSFVVTKLPRDGTLVAADAVATTTEDAVRAVKVLFPAAATGRAGPLSTVVPPGTRIYIAGQAERSESLADATRKTLESLRATLRFLGRGDADIVQPRRFSRR
jgi:enamine deaminase RidA (YjgF/YER057c/UK114 family)